MGGGSVLGGNSCGGSETTAVVVVSGMVIIFSPRCSVDRFRASAPLVSLLRFWMSYSVGDLTEYSGPSSVTTI